MRNAGEALKKVAILDSGYGGLTVVTDILLRTDSLKIFYFADFKNSPYGNKPRDRVREIVENIVIQLIKKNVDCVLLACNTATAVAVEYLRKKFPIPIYGMEPAIKLAIRESEECEILVLATELTLREDKFHSLRKRVDPMNKILTCPCPNLAKWIDELNWEKSTEFVREVLSSEKYQDLSSLVLGCTHYIFLEKYIHEMFPRLKIYHGNKGTVLHLIRSQGIPENPCNSISDMENRIGLCEFLTNSEIKDYANIAKSLILKRAEEYFEYNGKRAYAN